MLPATPEDRKEYEAQKKERDAQMAIRLRDLADQIEAGSLLVEELKIDGTIGRAPDGGRKPLDPQWLTMKFWRV